MWKIEPKHKYKYNYMFEDTSRKRENKRAKE
jgi:hypothetical protein